jgi:hypothetical protein
MRPSPTYAITATIALPPIAAAGRTVSMQDRDDCVAFGIDNEDHAIHPLAIGRWNAVGQSSELSATDHE